MGGGTLGALRNRSMVPYTCAYNSVQCHDRLNLSLYICIHLLRIYVKQGFKRVLLLQHVFCMSLIIPSGYNIQIMSSRQHHITVESNASGLNVRRDIRRVFLRKPNYFSSSFRILWVFHLLSSCITTVTVFRTLSLSAFTQSY